MKHRRIRGVTALSFVATTMTGAIAVGLFYNFTNYINARTAVHQAVREAARCLTPSDGSCTSAAPTVNPSTGQQWFGYQGGDTPTQGDVMRRTMDYSATLVGQNMGANFNVVEIDTVEPTYDYDYYSVPYYDEVNLQLNKYMKQYSTVEGKYTKFSGSGYYESTTAEVFPPSQTRQEGISQAQFQAENNSEVSTKFGNKKKYYYNQALLDERFLDGQIPYGGDYRFFESGFIQAPRLEPIGVTNPPCYYSNATGSQGDCRTLAADRAGGGGNFMTHAYVALKVFNNLTNAGSGKIKFEGKNNGTGLYVDVYSKDAQGNFGDPYRTYCLGGIDWKRSGGWRNFWLRGTHDASDGGNSRCGDDISAEIAVPRGDYFKIRVYVHQEGNITPGLSVVYHMDHYVPKNHLEAFEFSFENSILDNRGRAWCPEPGTNGIDAAYSLEYCRLKPGAPVRVEPVCYHEEGFTAMLPRHIRDWFQKKSGFACRRDMDYFISDGWFEVPEGRKLCENNAEEEYFWISGGNQNKHYYFLPNVPSECKGEDKVKQHTQAFNCGTHIKGDDPSKSDDCALTGNVQRRKDQGELPSDFRGSTVSDFKSYLEASFDSHTKDHPGKMWTKLKKATPVITRGSDVNPDTQWNWLPEFDGKNITCRDCFRTKTLGTHKEDDVLIYKRVTPPFFDVSSNDDFKQAILNRANKLPNYHNTGAFNRWYENADIRPFSRGNAAPRQISITGAYPFNEPVQELFWGQVDQGLDFDLDCSADLTCEPTSGTVPGSLEALLRPFAASIIPEAGDQMYEFHVEEIPVGVEYVRTITSFDQQAQIPNDECTPYVTSCRYGDVERVLVPLGEHEEMPEGCFDGTYHDCYALQMNTGGPFGDVPDEEIHVARAMEVVRNELARTIPYSFPAERCASDVGCYEVSIEADPNEDMASVEVSYDVPLTFPLDAIMGREAIPVRFRKEEARELRILR